MPVILQDHLRIGLLDRVNERPDAADASNARHVFNADDNFVGAAAEVDNVFYHSEVILVRRPVGDSKGNGGLKQPPPLHDDLSHCTHIPHIIEKGKAPPDVYINAGHDMLDHVFGIRPVSPEVRLPDKCLQKHVRHTLPEKLYLLKGALFPVHHPDMPPRATMTFRAEQTHRVIAGRQI